MGIIETAKTFFCLEKCMILVSVPVCYKFGGRKGFFRDGKNWYKPWKKTAPWKKPANPV